MTSPYILFTGPVLIGSILNWGFFGILALQVYNFSQSFPKERLGIKILVYTLLTLDTIQSVFATSFAWGILVSGWGDPTVFARFSWSGVTIPIMTGLVSAIVQLFFAWRIWVLKPGSTIARCLSILVVVVALLQSSSAFAGGIKFALASNIEQFAALAPITKIWLSGSFVCDILIAGSMIWILTAARSSSAFKRTDSLITKLIINAIETGAITAVTALAELLLFIKMDTNFVHEVPALLLGKLYSNVVLATLNGRLRARSLHVPSDGINTTEGGADSHQLSLRANYYSRDTDRDKTVIHVSTEIEDDVTTSSSNFKEPV